jgi:hypothetical protein
MTDGGALQFSIKKIMIKSGIPHIQNILAVIWKGKERHTSILDLTSFKLKTLVTMSSGLATDHQA